MLLWCELPSWLRMSDSAASGPRPCSKGSSRSSEPSVGRDLDGGQRGLGHRPARLARIGTGWPLRRAGCASWIRRGSSSTTRRAPPRTGRTFTSTPTSPTFTDTPPMPDAAARWREQMAELADRPDLAVEPARDAVRAGDEPVVVSEFGTWGLPDPGVLDGAWWAQTGDGPARPGGIDDRFRAQRLDRSGRTLRRWRRPRARCSLTRCATRSARSGVTPGWLA